MRLPIIPPAELNAEQKPLYDDMRDGIAKNFQGFINIRDDGTLLGPWNPWIHEPKFGKPVWELTKGMVQTRPLPPTAGRSSNSVSTGQRSSRISSDCIVLFQLRSTRLTFRYPIERERLHAIEPGCGVVQDRDLFAFVEVSDGVPKRSV